ncbi:glycoside hydrolase domain-containing protein [Streptomyces clavuligerus]|uniref:DUF1906 multi-domain protein n=2 Tax=Streptomyces clavuligerus TaxID=1901 RepID=D5SKY9_STRCL|nr:DUF1906 multi-domain protein [Streptomyces clavuligerus]
MVLRAQRFVNSAYGERLIGMKVEEDGRTRWEVMHALTRALQYELGITPLSNSFGPTTLSTLQSRFPLLNATTVPNANFARLIQSALYCKGYDGGEIDGVYNPRVAAAVSRLKRDMGVDGVLPGGDLPPKVFKGLLTMDAYVTVNNGSDAIRGVQQWLNSRYLHRRDFFVIPCDGHNSRDVAKSFLFAIQYELGMADGTANGVFGPGTQAGLRSHPVGPGSQGIWVSLFSGAMVLNHRQAAFTSSFDGALADEARAFQSFVKLPVTGGGSFSTWASLLVSYGDQSRKGEACDGVTRITPARAAALKADGITIVGRYLTAVGNSLPEKVIQPGELRTIADSGMRCFPIYQTVGRNAAQYSYALGRAAGYAAMNAAMDHGFQNGARIFFAVDFDALDHEVTSNVLPHFKGVEDSMADAGNPYRVGVYGPRNVCTRVGAAGHSSASFVSDMSSGFSGNYGYPLPPDWAYDQFVTRWVGSGDGRIEIDNNIVSGRDLGENTFNPPRAQRPDTALHASLHASMLVDVNKYMQSIGFSESSPVRFFSHAECFQQVMVDGDAVITEVSNRYDMRKALVQTSTYWEMRHIGIEDRLQDDRVVLYHSGLPGGIRDSSTGIAQITGNAGLRAWNHCIGKGYVSGTVRDPDHDPDLYAVWNQVRDPSFALRTVALIHLWDAEGKPGGNNPPGGETVMRPMALDYNDQEIFQVLRRYQGWGEEAETHARQRMGLYYLCEKYNGISRNM